MSENLLVKATGEVVDRVGSVANFAARIISGAMNWGGPSPDEIRYQLGDMNILEDETFIPESPKLAYTLQLADGLPLELTPTNTKLVVFDRKPELDHVRVTHRSKTNRREIYRFYQNPTLLAGLASNEFPIAHVRQVKDYHNKHYADWLIRSTPPDDFESSFARLLDIQ